MKFFRNLLYRIAVACIIIEMVVGPFAPVFELSIANAAAVPTILSYQGRLTDASGALLGGSGTNYYFKFSLWSNASIGSGTKLWPTSSPTSFATQVKQGVFNVNIGDTTNGYPDVLDYNFANASNLYLQVEVSSDNSTFETLSPRQLVTSAAFSQVSGSVSGVNASTFGTTSQLSNSVVSVVSTTSTAVGLTVRGAASQSANIFNIQDYVGTNLLSVNSAGGLQVSNLANCNTIDTDASGNFVCGTDEGGVGSAWATTSNDYYLSTKTTTNISEGSNLYFTNSRADARVVSVLSSTTTLPNLAVLRGLTDVVTTNATTTTLTLGSDYITDLTGSGLSVVNGALTAVGDGTFSTTSANYWDTQQQRWGTTSVAYWDGTQNRWATTSSAYFLSTKSTTDLTEGSNLYFTNARADARAVSVLSGTTSLPNITTLLGLSDLRTTNASVTNLTLGADYITDLTGSGLSVVNGALTALGDGTFSTTSSDYYLSTKSTTNVAEGSNLYWTDARFDTRLSATTTLPNLAVLRGLTDVITTNATTTTFALGSDYITDLTGSGLSVVNGALTATDTSWSTTSATYWDSTLSRWATTSDSFAFDTRLAATTTLNNITTLGGLSLPLTQTTGTLSVARGGTGQTAFGQGWLASDGTTLTSSTSPTVNYITATSTTATSTFPLLSVNTLTIPTLLNCDTLDTDATGKVVCGADAGAGGGITSLNGLTNSTQTFATTSDTNIGLSIVSSGSTHTFTPTWTGTLSVARGGTGLGSFTNNQILIGNASGGISQVATSSLGLLTTNITEGANLYWTDARFDTRLSATTSLANIGSLSGLVTIGSSSALTKIVGNLAIGTDTADVPLNVNGAIQSQNGTFRGVDQYHQIVFANGANRTDYTEWGDTLENGGGHRFFSGGDNMTLKFQIADNGVYSANSIGIGTTSPYAKLSVVGQAVAEYFTATSTTATSTFPLLSTNAINLNGTYITSLWSTTSDSFAFDTRLAATTTLNNITNLRGLTDLIATRATTTGATTTALAVTGVTSSLLKTNAQGSVLAAVAGTDYLTSALTSIGPANQTQTGSAITIATSTNTTNGLTTAITVVGAGNTLTLTPSVSGTLTVAGGGTGINTPTAAGILLGNYAGTGWQQLATSSLGLLTTNITEGANLYWTDARFDTRLAATTTLNNITTLGGLSLPLTQTTGTLSVARGGTGQTAFGQGWLASDGTTLTSSTSPTVAYITATSTTGTSTFSGSIYVNGRLGIGTTNPVEQFDISDTARIGNEINIVALGSANDVGLYFNDQNTGLFGPAADTFALSTNGIERWRVDSVGNFGIGTTSPYAKLSVVGQAVAEYFTATSTTATSTFPLLSTNAINLNGTYITSLWSTTSDSFAFDTRLAATTTLNNITTLGGLSLPITQTTGTLSVARGGTGQTSFGQGWLASNGTTLTSSTSPTVNYIVATSGTASILPYASTTAISVSSLSSGRLTYAGTDGFLQDSADLTYDGTKLLVSKNATDLLQLNYANSNFGAGPALAFSDQNVTLVRVKAVQDVFTGGAFTVQTGVGGNIFETLRVDSSGNLGVGTTSPYAKLSVAGEAVANIFTATSTTATSTFPLLSVNALSLGGAYVTSLWSTTSDSFAFDTRLAATTTLPNVNILAGLASIGSSTGTTTVLSDVVFNRTVSIGTTSNYAKLNLGATAGSNFREVFLRTNISDAGNTQLLMYNGTSVNNLYVPAIGGYQTSNARPSVQLSGLIDPANDASDSSIYGVVDMLAMRVASSSDPVNSATSQIQNRKLFTWRTHTDVDSVFLMTMLANGNLGIGSTSPYARLVVSGEAAANIFTATSTTATSTFPNINTSNIQLGSDTVNDFTGTGITNVNGALTVNAASFVGTGTAGQVPYFASAGSALTATSSLFIATSSWVGIGTTTPQAGLHIVVQSKPNYREDFLKFNTTDVGNDAGYLSNGSVVNGNFIATLSGYTDSSAAQGSLQLKGMTSTANDASDSSNAGLIDFLSVITSDSGSPNNGTLSSVTNRKLLTIRGGTNFTTDLKFTISANGNTGVGSSTPWGLLAVNPSGNTGPAFVVGSSTGTNFIVTNGGNVGIGTSSPYTRLAVVGDVVATTLTATSTTATSTFPLLVANALGVSTLTSCNTIDTDANGYLICGTDEGGSGGTWATTSTDYWLTTKSTTNLAEGSNLYWTDPRFDVRLTATTTLPNINILAGLASIGSTTGTTTFLGSSIINGNFAIGSTTSWGKAVITNVGTGPSLVVEDQAADLSPFIIDTSGSVGIGTTTTVTPKIAIQGKGIATGVNLQLYDGNGTPTFSVLDNGSVGFGSSTSLTTFIDPSVMANTVARTMRFRNNTTSAVEGFQFWNGNTNTNLLMIQQNGNVGVGTTSPSAKFAVNGDTWITGTATSSTYNATSTTIASVLPLLLTTNATSTNFFATTASSTSLFVGGNVAIGTSTPWAKISVSADNLTGNPSFAIGSSTGTHFVVANNGNIGIGTSSPFARLSILDTSGSVTPVYVESNVNSYSQFNIKNTNSGNAASSDYVATANIGTESTYYVNMGINGSGYNQTAQNAGNALDGYLYSSDTGLVIGTASTTNANADIRFTTGGLASSSIRAVITATGNFGIGTTAPMTTFAASSTTATPAAVIDQRGSGAILALQQAGTDKFVVANNGGLTISASTNDLVKTTTGTSRSSDFSVTGSTLFNVTSTNDTLELNDGTIPASGQGNLTSTSSTTPSAIGAGGHVILREDGMYVVIHGGASTAISLWNGTSSSMTALGVTLNANAGAGSISVRRPDGRYLVVHGGGVNTSSVIDPYGRTPTIAGPTIGGACTTGTNAFQRPDGKFVIMCGGTAAISVYDPIANTVSGGPASGIGNYGAGAHAIQRENGTFLVFLGGNTTSHFIYNPNTSAVGTFTNVNPITSNAPTITTGSFSIRRQDGKFLVLGGAINTSSIYDPTETATTTNMGAGTMTAQSGAGLGPTAALADGAQAFWRPDGKYLLIIGSGSATTNIIDPSQSGSSQFTAGPNLGTTAGAGVTAFMNPVGHYSILSGGGSAIDDYDMGYIIGGQYSNELSAYYETECMVAPGLNPQSTIGWHASNEGQFSVQVKTGTGSCSGSYKDIQKSGDLIHEDATTDNRIQVRVFFKRALPKFYDQEWNIRRTGLVRYRRNQMDPSLYDIYIDNGALYKRNTFDFANNSSTASSTIPTTVNLVVKTDGVGLGYSNVSNPEYNQTVNTTNTAFFNGSYSTSTSLIYGIASSSVVMKRPDGKFIIITGATSTPNSQLYNPDDETITAQTNIPTTNIGLGSLAIKRPDGKFLIVMGNAGTATTTTNIYDPVSNTYVYGPALMGPAGRGALVIPLPTGKYLIVHGNFTTTTSVYDPYQNTMSIGPVTQNVAGAGSMALPRPDGTYLFIPGTTNETCTLSTATNIFDPNMMTFRANTNQNITTGVGAGAFAFQRTDGLYVIVHGGGTAGGCAATNRTAIYNPFNNRFIVGPTLAAIPNVATQRWEGNHAFQAADGSWVMMVAGASSTVRTLIYQEKTGAYTADMPAGTAIGTWISGSTQGPWTGGSGIIGAQNNYNSIGPGAISFQLPNGKYLLLGGAASSSATSTRTFKMDMGWVAQGMYRTEQINIPDLDSNSVLNWKVSPNYLGVSAEVRTASTQAGLQTAAARPVAQPGGKINPSAGDVWMQVTFNFKRDFPSYKGVYTDVWYNGATPVHTTRDIQSPTLSEISVTKDIDALNLNSDGLSVFRVTSAGNVYTADGATINTSGADLAERYTSQVPLENGEVVAIDPQNNHGIKKTVYQYQPDVIGVVSTAPGFVAGAYTKDSYPVALVGRVPVKVTTENGMIYSGDRLAPSSVPGYAMKATLAGRVIGKALENLDPTKLTDCPIGTANVPGRKCGTVMMFVNLIDYSGDSVESSMAEWNRIKALAVAPSVDENTPLLDISTSTAQVNSTEDNILAYLKEVKAERESGIAPKSEIFSDKVTAITSIIAPQLFADAIKTKTIMGGALVIDTIGSTSTLVSMISDTTFFGRTYFTKDTGGTAIIKKGATQVEVTFEKDYVETPVVNATMSFGDELSDDDAQKILDNNVSYIITKKSVKGFTIRTKKAIEQDITFNWTALAIKNGGVFTSKEIITPPLANVNATTATSTASTTETVKEIPISTQPANVIEAVIIQPVATSTSTTTPVVVVPTVQASTTASSTPVVPEPVATTTPPEPQASTTAPVEPPKEPEPTPAPQPTPEPAPAPTGTSTVEATP